MIPLPTCPKCGLQAQIRLRERGMNMGSSELRCPEGHFRVGTSFHSGMKNWARNWLLEEWEKKVKEAAEANNA
ncbi:hypothetical protein SD66_08690 [Enterobacter cloacae]|nr:hypothetical protein SD66_08690 [Enterobacter cloacae]